MEREAFSSPRRDKEEKDVTAMSHGSVEPSRDESGAAGWKSLAN